MYRVALVQNQSEMAHYGYADARPLLDDLAPEYSYWLVTGDNISELGPALHRRQVDAVVLGSNALNDKSILHALCQEPFAALLGEFLATGRGLLALQQIGLAMRRGPTLDLLPQPLGRIRPVVIGADDTALTSGRLGFAPGAQPHVAMSYPHVLDPEQIREHACSFQGLPGLYWHYWEQVDLADWDQLLVDVASPAIRPLVVASHESAPWRVVVSALPFDWQKQREAFTNLLVYATEGRHNLAMVTDRSQTGPYEYLRQSLLARHIAFGTYRLPDECEALTRNVSAGIHSTLLVTPGLHAAQLSGPLEKAIERGVLTRRLRVLDIGHGAFGARSVSILSRDLHPRRLLQRTELQIQTELRGGYIDDSFWSHVETLQTLEQMPDRTVDYRPLLDAAWTITRNHDRKGSYDEIIGATCAYYWMRATYIGVNSAEALATEKWLHAAVQRADQQQKALAYATLASVGRLTAAEHLDLVHVLEGLTPAHLSETHLLIFLRAVLVARRLELARAIADELVARQRDGAWLDLTTTAAISSVLIDVHEALRGHGDDALRERLESSARAAVIVILRALTRSEASETTRPYPWDGKASTTVKCLQAWLKFDGLLDLPIYEILESLRGSDRAATSFASNRTALRVLAAINEENADLRADVAALHADIAVRDARLGAERRRIVTTRRALVAALTVSYVLVFLIVGFSTATKHGFGAAAEAGFPELAELHVAIVALVVSLGAVQWYRGGRKSGDDATPA